MTNPTSDQLLSIDREHIWHPYSSINSDVPIYPVKSASGCTLTLYDGTELIDGMASWWSAIHGYNNPRLNQALLQQTEQMAHVMFGGLTHAPAVELSQKLINITPQGMDKVFLADSGSVAVEVALKMAVQYWLSTGNKQKTRFISLKHGYHGDTLGAMSVCDPVNGMHHLFNDLLPKNLFANAPSCHFGSDAIAEDIAELEGLLKNNEQHVAAVIIEPVVQGAGGMRIYSADYVRRVRELCNQYNTLLIADEIATGFGRTGELFACDHANISPDILCLGKALTGGYMTLAATLCTNQIAKGICDGPAGVFMHGPTFMANPLACSVANASINLLLQSPWQDRVFAIEKQLRRELEPCETHENVQGVRVLGAIGVVELKKPVNMATFQAAVVEQGIWLRPFGKLLYTMPPFIITPEELRQITKGIVNLVNTATTA